MTYKEFLDRTIISQQLISYIEYMQYIEPVYISNNHDKNFFCKVFFNLYEIFVDNPIENIYQNNIENLPPNSLKKLSNTAFPILKKNFLRKFKKLYKRLHQEFI